MEMERSPSSSPPPPPPSSSASAFCSRRRRPRRGGGASLLGLGLGVSLAALLANPAQAWRLPTLPSSSSSSPARSAATAESSSGSSQSPGPMADPPQLGQALRRSLQLASLLLAPSAAVAFPGLEDCVSESNPSFTVVTCDKHIGIEGGRPKKCQASENCISTSSVTNPSKYSSPWVYSTNDVNEAFLRLVKAVEDNAEGLDLKIVEVDSPNHYLRAEGKSKVPPGSVDDLEFKLDGQDSLVFFRTGSRRSVFVYPVQQPLSDGGTLKKRLDVIQKAVGWQSINDYYQY